MATEPSLADRRPVWPHACLVALVSLAVYLPTCGYELTNWDDAHYTWRNPYVARPGWPSLRDIWFRVLNPAPPEIGYYQPLTITSLMIDGLIGGGGPRRGAPAFHLTNAMLHSVNAALVCVLAHRLVGHRLSALLAGLLFAVHPINVEAAAWVSARKALLCGLFVLLTLIAYARYARSGLFRYYGVALGTYLLSLTAKPAGITLGFVLLLLDFWPFRRLSGRALLEKVPFIVLGALWGLLAALSQARNLTVVIDLNPVAVPLEAANQLLVYLEKTFWPTALYPYYTPPMSWSWSNPVHWSAVAMIGAGLILVAVLGRGNRALAVAAGTWLLLIAPALGVVKHSPLMAADRFAYLPMIGLLVGLAALLRRVLLPSVPVGATAPARVTSPRGILAGVLLVGIVALTVLKTVPQRRIWSDSLSLWSHVLKHEPGRAVPQCMYANSLAEAGQGDQALPFYRRAISLDPGYANAHLNMGLVLCRLGRPEEAEPSLRRAVELAPSAKAYAGIADAYLRQGRMELALEHYQAGVREDPRSADTQFGLATTLQRLGRVPEAIEHYRIALLLNPEDAGVLNNLALAYREVGRTDEALACLREASRIDPGNPVVRRNLAELEGRFPPSGGP